MSIYREKALNKMSSPEGLDDALVVASPKLWLAFSTIFVVVASAVTWGFFGSVPTRIFAEGILLDQGTEVFSATAEGNGQLIKILVEPGTVVEAGAAVAMIKQDVEINRLDRATDALQRERERRLSMLEVRDEDLSRRNQLKAQQIVSINEKISNFDHNIEILNEQIADMEPLVTRGYVNRSELLSLESERVKVREEISDLNNSVFTLELEMFQREDDWRQQLTNQDKEIEARLETQEELTQMLILAQTVDAPVAGTVTEISASLGDVVATGTPIVRISTNAQKMDVLLFVSPADGKRVKPGFSASIEPSVVKREEFGSVVGIVASISELPLSNAAINAILHNDKLVEQFSQNGSPVVIRADLISDPNTVSQLTWTTGSGPNFDIESGTMAKAAITVSTQAPVSLILPFLKSVVGL
jgi:HlyD family secretion protein